jgi:hypothetical protein
MTTTAAATPPIRANDTQRERRRAAGRPVGNRFSRRGAVVFPVRWLC